MRRFGVRWTAVLAAACTALAHASCESFYPLDGLTGGTCDAGCTDASRAWPSGEDATVTAADAEGDDGAPNGSQDAIVGIPPEVGLPETGPGEAAVPEEGGAPEAGLAEAGPVDGGPPDAGSPDAGLPEGAMPEAGLPDAGLPEGGLPEAGPPEGGAPETGPPGQPEAGPPAVGPDASPSCECVPPPPAGWTGPVSIWEGAGAAPGCSGDYPAQVLDAFADLAAAAAQCTCECGPLTGASCASTFTATIFGDQGCTSSCDSVTVSAGTCVNVHGQCANVRGISAAPSAQGGSCTPRAAAVVPTAKWGRTARACESMLPPAQTGCPSGQVCASAPAAPMEPRLCVLMAGAVPCPPGAYSVQRTVFGGFADGRGCTACSCGAPSGISCTAALQEGCGQTGPVHPLPTTCGGLSDPGSVTLLAVPVADGGSCSPDGGVPTGSAAPSSPVTVCCMP